jgi:lipopolysaccharide/colanic/teichoic acid biosynthesis glycosyltransferase
LKIANQTVKFMYRNSLKRLFDLAVSLLIGLILIPLFLAISIVILIKMGKPVLFIQERPGLNGKIFKIYKFRSMVNYNSINGIPLLNYQRITKFGNFLRKSSLDELPEVLNVLIGDMSIVGPRPLLKEYLTLYNQEQARRHEVRPGITGLAQVKGRNEISWEEKFELDVFYVNHVSFVLDMKILILTVWKAIKREGINTSTGETVKKFTGSKN